MFSPSISSTPSGAQPVLSAATKQSIDKKTAGTDKKNQPGSVGAYQPPPSYSQLRAVTSQRCRQFSPLPTEIIRKILFLLIPGEALQLMLTGHFMNDEVQSICRRMLRPEVARVSVSPILSYQNWANIRPHLIQLGAKAEQTYQECMAMKASNPSKGQYCSFIIRLLRTRMPEVKSEEELRQLFCGVTLAWGGREMAAENCEVLLELIRLSHRTSSLSQMYFMMQGVCRGLGGAKMRAANINAVVKQIVESHPTCSTYQISGMITGVCDALGGKGILPITRDSLISQALGFHMPLPLLCATMNGLCDGFGAQAMTPQTRDALMARFLDIYQSRDYRQWDALRVFFHHLGKSAMTPDNRDALLETILAASPKLDAQHTGILIWSLYSALGGRDITQKNFNALNTRVITSLTTNNALLTGALISGVYLAAGGQTMTPEHRDALRLQIQESGRVDDIVAGLKRVQGGLIVSTALELV